MKVLLVYNESSVEGKGNVDLFSVFRELRRLGHEPVMVVRKDHRDVEPGIHQLFPEPMKAFLSLPILIKKMAVIMREHRPDIVMAEGGWYIPAIVSFANRRKVPVVYVFRGLVLEVLVAFHAKSLAVKAAARVFIGINYRIFRKSRYLVGTNTSICKFYSDRLDRRVELVGTHLIDPRLFMPIDEAERDMTRSLFSITPGSVAILYSGAMEQWHLPYLIDLAEVVSALAGKGRNVQLVVMGWGSCRDRFADYLKEKQKSGLPCVILPFLRHDDVPKVISSCDICVDPLLRPYPMDHAPAGKLMEYMACGLCVVTTKGYSNEELVQDRMNGLVVNGSRASLFAALEELVQDRQAVKRYGQAARETIITYFAKINDAEALASYLESAVRDR